MRLKVHNISRVPALAGFLVLFPGFMVYHYSIAQGWIPPFLGGLFGIAAVATALVALVLSPWLARHELGAAMVPTALVGVWLWYTMFWSFANYEALHGAPYVGFAMAESAATVMNWIAMVFIGAFFTFDDRRTHRALVISTVCIMAVMLHAMVRFRSPLGPYITFTSVDDTAGVSSYQGIGRSVLITTIFLAASTRSTGARFAIFALGSVLLLLVGSRSDLFSLVLLTVAMIGLLMLRGANPLAILSTLAGCWVVFHFTAPLFLETRNAEILDLANSSSWQARQEMQAFALNVIREHPFMGEFGYHFRIGGSGFFAHNALSAWTNYGLLGFVLYLGLITWFTVVSLRHVFVPGGGNGAWFAAFQLNFVALIQAVSASPVFSPLPALGWGLAINAMRTAPVRPLEPEKAPLLLPEVER
jgi:hypothetical protein